MLTNALSRRVFFDVMPDINSVGQNGGSQTGPGMIVVMNIMSPTAGDMGTYGCHILGTSVSRYVDVYDIINPLPTKGKKKTVVAILSLSSLISILQHTIHAQFFYSIFSFQEKKDHWSI